MRISTNTHTLNIEISQASLLVALDYGRQVYLLYAGNCCWSKDELLSDVRRWTLSYGRASVRRPGKTYPQQPSTYTKYCLEDLLEANDDRDELLEGVWESHASGQTWYIYIYIYIYIERERERERESDSMINRREFISMEESMYMYEFVYAYQCVLNFL